MLFFGVLFHLSVTSTPRPARPVVGAVDCGQPDVAAGAVQKITGQMKEKRAVLGNFLP